jgi:hypothetical protein
MFTPTNPLACSPPLPRKQYMFMTSLLVAYRLDWGGTVRWLFAMESSVSGGMPPLLGCLSFGFMNQAKLMLALPLLLVALVALAISAWRACVRCKGGQLVLWGAPPFEVFRNALMALSFILWPSFCGHVLRVLDCSVEVGGVSYLASDLSVNCADAEYKAVAAVASVYLYTLVPALPLALFVLLQRNKHHLDELTTSPGSMLAQEDALRFHQRYSFLFAGYATRVWRWTPRLHGRSTPVQLVLAYIGSVETRLFVWWECVVMVRKALLVGVTVWFARDPQYQIYAGLWVLLVSFFLQVLCKPYSNPTIGFLETLSLGATMVTLLLGQALALGGMSGSTETFIRTLAALINIAMLCYFVRHALRQLAATKTPLDALERNTSVNPMLSSGSSWIRTPSSQCTSRGVAAQAETDQAETGQPETDDSRHRMRTS